MNSGRRVILTGALLATVSPLFAQDRRVSVDLFDAEGHSTIRDAKVTLLRADDKPAQTVISDAHAQARFTGVPVGTARFRIECPGFETWMLAVNVPTNPQISVALVIGPIVAALFENPQSTATLPESQHSGRVRFRVMGQAATVLSDGQISLMGPDGKPQQTMTTGPSGELIWNGLPVGRHEFRIQRIGFLSLNLTVVVSSDAEVRQAAVLLLPPDIIYPR